MSGQAPIRAASDVYFFIATQDGLVRLLHDLSSCPVVAVDTESNSFYAYYERICLIQLSTPDADYIVDPLAGLDLSPLGERFADPLIQKVFHAAEQDVAGLKRDFGFGFANLFDTMWAARILGWARIGLADILREIFDVHTDKRYQRYDWGKRPLEPTALAYARRDTHYLLALRELQVRALEEMKRNEEAAEVFARLTQTPPACVPFGPEAFWRVKGVHDLNGREQAVLWELYLWRDRMARAQNQPPFRVMNDQTLGILARTRPRTLVDLSHIPGLTHATIRQYGRALMAAVARGEAGPIPQPPPRPEAEEAVLSRYRALHAWRRRVAAHRKVEADVVLPNAVLWALAEHNPTTSADLEGIPGLGPWKRNTYGEAILNVLKIEKSRRAICRP